MNGLERITSAFESAQRDARAALITYLTLGYPDEETSLEAVIEASRSGADLIELGIPFSDPLADGPTIQHSTQVALSQHVTVKSCLDLAARIRERGVSQPLLFMGYVNPIFAYGIDAFAQDAARAGVDGLIIPDLPPEEASLFERACEKQNLALVFLLSPASPVERIEMIARRTSGFLYLVSLTGVTGVRNQLPPDLAGFVTRARGAAHTPVAVGFGISTPRQAGEVGAVADGVIVGSAIINAMRDAIQKQADPAAAAGAFIKGLRKGLTPVSTDSRSRFSS